MHSVFIGVLAWLGVQPLAGLALYPLLRAASGRDPAREAPDEEPSPVIDLTMWSATHHRRRA